MDEKTILDFEKVPASYMMCFNASCPKAATCLHLLAGASLPATITCGPAIYPNAKTDGKGCKFFDEAKPVQMAWGFSKLFDVVRYRDAKMMRDIMAKKLGNRSNYYRYNRGEKLLNPQEQEKILNIFRKSGYETGLEFDHYVTTYDFTD